MGKASSAKKVARLAERGKGKKVRFRGGGVFPLVVAGIVVVGTLLVIYARDTSQSDAAGPKVGDHWHLAYGIYLCDTYLDPFQDNKESTEEYQFLQIHTHGDGVMHWHPGNERAINRTTGRDATFDDFLDLYGVDLSDDKLVISGAELSPPGADQVYEEGVTTCTVDGEQKEGSLRVLVFNRYDTPGDFIVRTSSLGNERILEDQQVFVIAFVPNDTENNAIPMPPWAGDLPELGAVDTVGGTVPTTVPTDASATTAAAPAAASSPSSTDASSVTSATTAAATTAAPTTAAPSTSGG